MIGIRKIAGVCNLKIEKKEYIFDRAFIFEIPNFTDAVIVQKNPSILTWTTQNSNMSDPLYYMGHLKNCSTYTPKIHR